MAELNFTPEQRAAIDTRGSTVLVSAAAGSGKTRVLTERLMAYLTDAEDPVDIDRFLVITYTRAAAAEPVSYTHLVDCMLPEPANDVFFFVFH